MWSLFLDFFFPAEGKSTSIMSIDFDSAALQTQHDEDEYDQEDYAREQEVCEWIKFVKSSF